MKQFFKAHYKKVIILSIDVLCVIAAVLARPMSEWMLTSDSACAWTLWGGQCLTCGGTHFVNDLTSFRIIAAFMDNQFLFILTLYFLVTMVMLNLMMLFDLAFAKKVLKWMYNVPVLITFFVSIVVFIVVRNWFAFPNLFVIFEKIGVILVEKFPRQ